MSTTELEPRLGEHIARVIGPTTGLEFVAGEGAELIAADGRRYLDAICGYAVTSTGHCHPHVVEAVREQVGRLIHVSTVGANRPARAYAARLSALLPIPDAQLFFTNSGTESVEAALKLARYATGRPNVVSFGGGFHGRTMGSLSVTTSKAAFRAHHEPLLPGCLVVPYPRREGELQGTLDALARLFLEQTRPDRVAAFLVEPVLGEGGYVVPPDGFLPALRELADRHGILLIADEVQAGFGRTGRMFACEHTGVVPDLMTLGKAIASGLPMGALAGRTELMDAWERGAHGNTFGGGPVICAAALATLDVLESEGLVENAAARGEQLRAGLAAMAREYPEEVREVRGRGLMVGLELASAHHAARVFADALEAGLVLSTCGPHDNVVRIAPPLILTPEQVEWMLSVFAGALAASERHGADGAE